MAESSASPDLGYQAHRLARLLRRRLEAELTPLGLTGPQAAALLALASAAELLPPAALAGRLGMDRPTLSGVLARLERDGWLASKANPGDGRSRLLHLTGRAQEALPELRAASSRVSADALRGMEVGEVERLLAWLEDISSALEDQEREERR